MKEGEGYHRVKERKRHPCGLAAIIQHLSSLNLVIEEKIMIEIFLSMSLGISLNSILVEYLFIYFIYLYQHKCYSPSWYTYRGGRRS